MIFTSTRIGDLTSAQKSARVQILAIAEKQQIILRYGNITNTKSSLKMSVKYLINQERSYISELFERINSSYSIDKPTYVIKDKVKFIDLFAGIGGMRIAFESDHSKCVFSNVY